MEIRTNDKNEIMEYAVFGGLSNGIEIDDSLKPVDFDHLFKPSFYLYQDNQIVVNPNYEEPTISIPEPQPSAEQQAITDLAINSAEHDQHIQSIEEAITALAQSQMGGTN